MITVWTNGCFDILHPGHMELFKIAKSLGDRLIVGLDTDEKVRKDKGSNRPINSLDFRKSMLESNKNIDLVIPFGSRQESLSKLLNCTPLIFFWLVEIGEMVTWLDESMQKRLDSSIVLVDIRPLILSITSSINITT